MISPDNYAAGVGRCILLVSDDEALFHRLGEMTEPHRMVISPADDCTDELLDSLGPDLIVVDLRHRGPDFQQLADMARDFEESVPVIGIADRASLEVAWDVVDQVAYDMIETPLQRNSVVRAVARALERRELAAFRRDHEEIIEQAVGRKTVDLVRSEEFLRGILNSSTLVSVVLTDLDQNVLFWNTGAENIFGYTAEEMVGSKVTKLYPPDALTRETVEELRDLVKRKSGTVQGKMKQVAKDGRMLTVSLAISPMLGQFGELQGILGVGLDVTEEARQHEEILRLLRQVKKTQEVAIFTLAKLSESRDEETGLHLARIQKYCKLLCQGLSSGGAYRDLVTPELTEDLYQSCVLHDIGKVAIPDEVLKSCGQFSPEEREIMKRHPLVGGRALEEAVKMLGQKSFLTTGMEVAYFHHERWDGTGYPFGLRGEKIPLAARIVAIADVYDALTTKRRYKPAFSHAQARDIITQEKGKQFDPVLVEAFLELESDFWRVRCTCSLD